MFTRTQHDVCFITDQTADTTPSELSEMTSFFPHVFPGSIICSGQPIADSPRDFYQKLTNRTYAPGQISTSAVGIGEALAVLERAHAQLHPDSSIVVLSTSPYISKGMYDHTLTAVEHFRELHPDREVVHLNTMCTAGGLALLCSYLDKWQNPTANRTSPYRIPDPATQFRDLVLSPDIFSHSDESLENIDRIRSLYVKDSSDYDTKHAVCLAYVLGRHTQHLFTEGSLDFPLESGRWNSQPLTKFGVQAINHIGVLPKMYFPARFDDASEDPNLGNLQTERTAALSWRRLLKLWTKTYFDQRPSDPWLWDVRIGYSGPLTSDQAYSLAGMLYEHPKFDRQNTKITIEHTSPFVGAHTGPDQLSFFFVSRDERPNH